MERREIYDPEELKRLLRSVGENTVVTVSFAEEAGMDGKKEPVSVRGGGDPAGAGDSTLFHTGGQ